MLAVACAGCSGILGIGDFALTDANGPGSGDGSGSGSGSDGSGSGSGDAALCFGTLAQLCFQAPPSGPVTIDAAVDTDSDPRCVTIAQATGQPELCAIAGDVVTVTGTIRVTGGRPLALVGASQLVVNGMLDASSLRGGTTGAGANPPDCASGATPSGGAGGAGGSFGARGGNGGNGEAAGGVAGMPQGLMTVRGGCAGQAGNALGSVMTAAGGAGGGALYLVAGGAIQITGEVLASGAGGGAVMSGGNGAAGGGGGGAGGLVALEAPSISGTGQVAANGGGGGGGTGILGGGTPGADGTTGDTAAAGGMASQDGGAGGNGGHASAPSGQSGANAVINGGGGGAGVGVIWTKGSVSGLQMSPNPTAG